MRSRVIIVFSSLLFVACGSITSISAEEPAPSSCGEENCHGLTVKCGPSPVQACNMMYELGDKCRRHVHCQTIEGKCTAIETEEFRKCKECVETCKKKESPDDPAGAFSCEARCE